MCLELELQEGALYKTFLVSHSCIRITKQPQLICASSLQYHVRVCEIAAAFTDTHWLWIG